MAKPCTGPNGSRSSTIEMTSDIERNGVRHAGSVSHVCCLNEDNHETSKSTVDGQEVILTVCRCECNYRWVRNFK